jgi:tRNA G18 (ribose-2'-O)-methylase SpoU
VPFEISDPADERIALYRNLRDVELRRSVEADRGVFVVEGIRTIRTLLDSAWPATSVLLTPGRLARSADLIAEAERRGVKVLVAGPEIFDEIAGFHVHRGALAIARRLPPRRPQELVAKLSAVAVVEAVNDHENLGAIFRNAAALGAGAVLLDPTCCDPLYRRSVRVSLGSVLRIPFARLEPWPDALSLLVAEGFTIVALDPRASLPIESFRAPEKVAVMVGSEGLGLSDAARHIANHEVRIPMSAGVDSLNVATALAIGLDRLFPASARLHATSTLLRHSGW